MKRRIMCDTVSVCLVLVLSLGILGCPQPSSNGGGGGTNPTLTPPVLTVTAGQAALTYSWTAANPDTDITYELYLKTGNYSDEKALISAAGTATVTKKSGNTPYSGTISSLTPVEYSVVVQAKDANGTTVYSNVAKATPTAAPSVNITALAAAITAAETAIAAIPVAENANSVTNGVKFITSADKTTYQTAIDAAKTVKNNSSSTQTQIDAALATLNTATTTFNTAIQTGTKTDETVSETTLTVTFTGLVDETITMENDNTNPDEGLSWKDNTSLTVTINEPFDSYRWYLDGEVIPDAGTNSLTLNAGDMAVQTHRLTVLVAKGENSYTKTLNFIVAE